MLLIIDHPSASRDMAITFIDPSLFASLTRKQSIIPGISRITVFLQVRSTMSTTISLGRSGSNYAESTSILYNDERVPPTSSTMLHRDELKSNDVAFGKFS